MLNLAMGKMNPALSKVGAESVSLTFVAGTLNRIGESSLRIRRQLRTNPRD